MTKLKVTKSTDRMLPPPEPVVQRREGKGKGKAVAKRNIQGGNDDEKSAHFIVQQAS